MDSQEITNIVEGALGLVPLFYPPAAPVVLIISKALPWIVAAAPVVVAAIKEGVPAFEAAKAQAPELTQAITELAQKIPMSSATVIKPTGTGADLAVHTENIARSIFGFQRMTFEQELDWMNKSVPPNDSRFGG